MCMNCENLYCEDCEAEMKERYGRSPDCKDCDCSFDYCDECCPEAQNRKRELKQVVWKYIKDNKKKIPAEIKDILLNAVK